MSRLLVRGGEGVLAILGRRGALRSRPRSDAICAAEDQRSTRMLNDTRIADERDVCTLRSGT